MSVINNMLKNIEQRETKQLNIENGITVKPVYDIRNIAFKVIVVVIMLLVIYAAYVFLPASTETHSLVVKQTKNISTKPDALVEKQSLEKPIVYPAINDEQLSSIPIENQGKVKTKQVPVEQFTVESEVQAQPVIAKGLAKKAENDVLVKAPNVKNTQNVSNNIIKPTKKSQQKNVMVKSEAVVKSDQVKQAELLTGAKQAIQFGLYDEAISDLNLILIKSPLHIEARNLLAGTYFKQQDINSAQLVLQEGIALNANVLEWRVMLSKILIMQGEYDVVLQLLSAEFESQANLDFWVLQGTAAQSASQHKQALNSFKHLTQLQPSQAKWWLALATSKDALGEYLDAKQLYKVALDLGGLNTAMTEHALQRLVALKEAV
ncbi:agglutinin biogenesis protein MshN [Pseudoalteromonas carrageenovora]|uniref:agglutinin biogenesis protein MshN n=1 Tax=Pseudoalteromonas carrageenovora TaxID=227 RepID=UPI0026E18F66|nr:agglutinin biogenesis protein MshN [Pseudoalteromonas carrageenovora]MDO6635845.1 agglutinin biogenesis protein MshN [Pseudoalteromonas carrageenovora]MDO6647838.1 agglutinin biogenesis protein MshN [Pseudoalteromonas carrageenovora]